MDDEDRVVLVGERAYSVASRVKVTERSVFDLSSALTSMASLRGGHRSSC